MTSETEFPVDQRGGPIHALLVDDNEQWGTFVANELERTDPELQITVVLSATEALLTLQETASIECVVTDYRMPEISGLELLERVRRERDRIPFILITGEGSEDVASRAIEEGVSDYLTKDPRVDQSSLLATKIHAAVANHRLRLAIEESEEQYRTVTEQSRDGILIIQDDRIAFCNGRMGELVGTDREDLLNAGFDWDTVHPDDRKRSQEIISTWVGGRVEEVYHDVRLVPPDGAVKHCEFIGHEITYGNEPALMVTFRDITSHIEQERALERERRLNRVVQELLITSRTREEFERSIVRELQDDRYPLAWIGELGGGTVACRSAAGETAYLDEFHGAPTESHPGEPVVWAVRSGEPQFVDGFEDLFPTSWCTAALERGLHAGVGLPLRYNDVTLGVLGVYADTAPVFDAAEQRLLTELADRLAFAIHNFERDRALAADHIVEASLRLDRDGYYLADLLASIPGHGGEAAVTVHGTISHEEGRIIQYLTLDGIELEAFEEAARADDRIGSTDVVAPGPDERVQVSTGQHPPEAALASAGAIVRSTRVTPSDARIRIELSPKRDIRDVVDGLEERFGPVSVESVRPRERTDPEGVPRFVDTSALTEKQTAALRAAYHQGYFEQPRLRSADEIAASLDIAHSTFLQHLRVAQRKVFSSLFE